MQKIISLILLISMLFSFTACANSKVSVTGAKKESVKDIITDENKTETILYFANKEYIETGR